MYTDDNGINRRTHCLLDASELDCTQSDSQLEAIFWANYVGCDDDSPDALDAFMADVEEERAKISPATESIIRHALQTARLAVEVLR